MSLPSATDCIELNGPELPIALGREAVLPAFLFWLAEIAELILCKTNSSIAVCTFEAFYCGNRL